MGERLRTGIVVGVLVIAIGSVVAAAAALVIGSSATPGGAADADAGGPVASQSQQTPGASAGGGSAGPAEPDARGGIAALPDARWAARVAQETGIPERAMLAYAGADLHARAEYGCEVGWNTLAAIGQVETHHGELQGGRIDERGFSRPRIVGIPLDGTSTDAIADTDDGEIDGDPDWDRAVGPMQFIPQTWEQWAVDGNDDGEIDVDSIDDAALTAARYLCEAHGTLDYADAWDSAIRSYNSSTAYRSSVAEAAAHYGAVGAAIE